MDFWTVLQTVSESVDNELLCTSQSTLESEFGEEDTIESIEDVNIHTVECKFALLLLCMQTVLHVSINATCMIHLCNSLSRVIFRVLMVKNECALSKHSRYFHPVNGHFTWFLCSGHTCGTIFVSERFDFQRFHYSWRIKSLH